MLPLNRQHVSDHEKELRPVGQRECDLVQSIADASWRLQRIPALESAIYAQGRIQFADQFNDQDPGLRSTLKDLHTHLAYEKQLPQPAASGIASAPPPRKGSSRAPPGPIGSPQSRYQPTLSRLASADANETRQQSLRPAVARPGISQRSERAIGHCFAFSFADIEAYSSGRAVLDIAYAAFRRVSSARNQMQIAA